MSSMIFSFNRLKNLNQRVPMPILIVIFVLSSELIIRFIINLVFETVRVFISYQLPISLIAVQILIKLISSTFTIVILVFIVNTRYKGFISNNFSSGTQFKSLVLVTLIYLSCLSFLIENSGLLISIFFSSEYHLWPNLIFSKVSFEDIAYQIITMFYLFLILPIFEELLFRKVIIRELSSKKLGSGFIIGLSSLIYSVPMLLFEVVEYSEGQAIYSSLLRFSSGLILCFLYLKTQKLVYPILLRLFLNLIIYTKFFVFYSSFFDQIGEYILLFLSILVVLGLFVFFIMLIDGFFSLRDSSSPIPYWLNIYSDFSFTNDSQLIRFLKSIVVILPFFPFGIILFVDHTILYNDFLGLVIKSGVKLIGLGAIFLLGVLNLINSEFKIDFQGPIISLRPILSQYFQKTRKNYRIWIKRTPGLLIRHSSIIFLIFGILSPFVLISVSVVTTIEAFIIFSAEVYAEISFGQSPFFSYNRLFTDIRSNIIFVGIQEITEESLYFLKHSNGKWFFLPDTFMSHPGDWFHGLITVGAWIGCLVLFSFIVQEYRKKQKIAAGVTVLVLILVEILWILFVFGLGSVSAEGRPTPPSVNQTLPEFIQTDFRFVGFFFLPIGLIYLILATIVLLLSGVRERQKDKKNQNSSFNH